MANMKYEIVKEIMVLPSDKEFHTEVNLISWNGNDPKVDIRRWTKDREKMSKGICLTEEEFKAIVEKYGGTYNEN